MPRKATPPTEKSPGPKSAEALAAEKELVLKHYSECGTLLYACLNAKVDYKTARIWKHEDPAFALALEAAYDPILDRLEHKAFERIEAGSDKILELMLKSLHGKYKDKRTIEHTGPGGGPIVIHNGDQVRAQLVAVAHQFPTVAPRLRQSLQEILDALPK